MHTHVLEDSGKSGQESKSEVKIANGAYFDRTLMRFSCSVVQRMHNPQLMHTKFYEK